MITLQLSLTDMSAATFQMSFSVFITPSISGFLNQRGHAHDNKCHDYYCRYGQCHNIGGDINYVLLVIFRFE
jgi:hypothetical protein